MVWCDFILGTPSLVPDNVISFLFTLCRKQIPFYKTQSIKQKATKMPEQKTTHRTTSIFLSAEVCRKLNKELPTAVMCH